MSKTVYIIELEEKIKRLEANKKVLLRIIEVYDEMLKSGSNKTGRNIMTERENAILFNK